MAVLVSAVLAASSSAFACVVGTGTSASCTEAALDTCLPGGTSFNGTVTFNCGGFATITVTSTKNISADTTIDGGSVITISGGSAVSVFFLAAAVEFTVQNLTIANGHSTIINGGIGGGISVNAGSTLTVTNGTFSGNTAGEGGGILNNGGSVTVADSTFSGNSVSNSGGGILNNGGSLTVANSTFSGNTATARGGAGGAIANHGTLTVMNTTFSNNGPDGGAIANNGTLTVSNSIFSANTDVSGAGGSGAITNDGTLTVTNSMFSANVSSSGSGGGAIFNGANGTLIVSNSTFSGNMAIYFGGAISIAANANVLTSMTVTNSTFSGNSSGVIAIGGGAIYNNAALTVTNSTFFDNSAWSGGAIGCVDAPVTVTNSTFVDNNAHASDGAIACDGAPVTLTNSILANSTSGGNCGGTVTDGGHNIDDGTTCGFTGSGCSNTSGSSFCNTNPLLDPAGLKYNGGPTQTIALEAGSPAIDAIPIATCPSSDQRNLPRPDPDSPSETACDIGAFESGEGPSCVSPPAGLVSWWPGDGNASDTIGGNNGTLSGGVSFAAGEVGQAFSLDGIDDFVSVANNNSLNPTGPFSVDLWVKADPQQTSPQTLIIDKSHGWTDSTGWAIQTNPDGSACFFYGTGGSGSLDFHGPCTQASILDGQWHHLAGEWTGTEINIYEDAVLQNTLIFSTPPVNNTRDVHIGMSWGGGTPTRFLHGLVDEVEYFNRALAAGEIQAIFTAGSAGKCKVPPTTTTSSTTSTTTSSTTSTTRLTTTSTSTTTSTTSTTHATTTTTSTSTSTSTTTTSSSTSTTHAPTTTTTTSTTSTTHATTSTTSTSTSTTTTTSTSSSTSTTHAPTTTTSTTTSTTSTSHPTTTTTTTTSTTTTSSTTSTTTSSSTTTTHVPTTTTTSTTSSTSTTSLPTTTTSTSSSTTSTTTSSTTTSSTTTTSRPALTTTTTSTTTTTTTTPCPSTCINPGIGSAGSCAVLELGGAQVAVTGGPGGIDGDVCIGPNGNLTITGGQFASGNIRLASGATIGKTGPGSTGAVLRDELVPEINDAMTAASAAAALPCTQTFGRLSTSQVVVGAGGQNVVCVGDVTLNGGRVVTLSGGASDTFIVNVTGRFALTGGSKLVGSGVTPSAILYNIIGQGPSVSLNGMASVDGTLLAVQRDIALTPSLVNGEVIGGQDISITGNASVGCASCVPAPPPKTRCCIQDDDEDNEVECKPEPPDKCAQDGGTDIGPGPCDDHACPSPPPNQIQCCIPGDGESECQLLTPDTCHQRGGTNIGAGTCDPDVCPPQPKMACCIAKPDDGGDHKIKCKHHTPQACAKKGGVTVGAGSCKPNPCAAASTPSSE